MSDQEFPKPVKVTVSDPETGAILWERLLEDEYALVTAGRRYLKSAQVWGQTHTLHVAVRK